MPSLDAGFSGSVEPCFLSFIEGHVEDGFVFGHSRLWHKGLRLEAATREAGGGIALC